MKQLDMEIMQLTAMFVAANGRSFLVQLMSCEAHNSQFVFLKPINSNFNYFTGLIEGYTKVIFSTNTIVDELQKELDYDTTVESIKSRVALHKRQNMLKAQQQSDVEKEKHEYNLIDWDDFVVVQTITFDESDMMNVTQAQ